MCNTFQISSLLAERIETNYSLPPSPAHFYLCGDEDTQLRGAVPRWGAGRCHTWFPFSPFSLPHIKSCHHHLSFVIKDCLSASDGQLQLLMSANMEGMIRRILTVTNFKYIVSCYQLVTVKINNVLIFLRREDTQTHANLSLPLGIWCCCTIKTVLILVPDIPLCSFFRFSQMYRGLRALADPLHFKYQWMQLLALEYSKGLFECVHASCMLPFVRVARLCGKTWMEISVCSCVRGVSCSMRGQRRERHKGRYGRNRGLEREREIDGVKVREIKGQKDFHSGFSWCTT